MTLPNQNIRTLAILQNDFHSLNSVEFLELESIKLNEKLFYDSTFPYI